MTATVTERCDHFTGGELARITGGRWLGWEGAAPAVAVRGVSDNSREVRPGMLFVAIRGETADGHRYIAHALRAGAAAVVAERTPDAAAAALLREGRQPLLLVPDALKAFQELARAHRQRFPALPVIGITGSCGKTSTKEMIAAVLEAQFPGAVLKTEGNTNNHFGVPRNLLRLTPHHQAAVLEMGTSHPGEIAALARLVEPGIAVICNIGHAHLEHLRDLAGVAREKGAIFAALPADGTAILPATAAHAEILRRLAGNRRLLTYGPATADVQVTYLGATAAGYGLRLTWNCHSPPVSVEFTWELGGAHQALNAGAAAAAAAALGIPPDRVVQGLRACRLPGMRMAVQELDGVLWANDAYNANPDSARASLQWFREVTVTAPATERLVILGEMRELGAAAATAHRELLRFAADLFPGSPLWGIGAEMERAAATLGLENLRTFPDWATAKPELERWQHPGLRVLLKGSRGVGLENLLPAAARGGDH
ncbi:MAG: UDP-N-acetylmuramoyl-tripeptide--D-alanyl-D-alanine ligase [Lentisphaeria bacterium]|jgi:UDP-N-acetylmuramoyl-tripeptide--D-alanyl-D-alanine ligase